MKRGKIVFKPYEQGQLSALPPSYEELIPSGHLVRVVNQVIENMKLGPLLNQYKGGGTSSYHPKMLLKVIIYAYTQKLYSSRTIAKALRENVHFMWLSGGNHPDFRTINRFRSSRLKKVIEKIFSELVIFLEEEGLIKFENYFLDGTKLEANANKYSWVWKKNAKRYKAGIEEKIKHLLQEIEDTNQAEEDDYGDRDLEELGEESEITEKKLEEAVKKIDKELSDKPGNKDLKKARKRLTENYIPRYEKYKKQEEKLGGRNSYSKTDEGSTFMRMKEDIMQNGQLKPAYNIQMGTENQFVLGWSIHQKPADTSVMIPHLEEIKKNLGKLPGAVIADAGYGSEENYEYLEGENKEAYVKYNYFYIEQKRKPKINNYHRNNLKYDKEKDRFLCPVGKPMNYKETQRYKTDSGYETERRIYEADQCRGCTERINCHKGNGNRRIQISFRLEELKSKARDKLLSEKGKKLRSQRGVDVETVFGQIKHNMQFKRFLLRGLNKVNIEYGLLCYAHNLKKLCAHGFSV